MSHPLLNFGCGFQIFGLLLMFFVPSAGVLMFIAGGSLLFIYQKTPQGKAELAQAKAKAEAEKQASIKQDSALKKRFQQFSNNPSDTESLKYVLDTLASQNKSYLKSWMRPIIIPLLKIRPLDSAVRDTVFSNAKIAITTQAIGKDSLSSKEVYEAALEVLSQHPDQIPLKQYALKVGRWHYGIQRPGGKVTIYDEQAINNDIAVRSK